MGKGRNSMENMQQIEEEIKGNPANKLPLSYKVQLFSGAYILLCIPMILLAERYDFTEAPFHITQAIAICISFAAGVVVFIRSAKKMVMQNLIISGLGVVLTGLYLSLVLFVVFGPGIEQLWHQRKFDAQVWRQSGEERGSWPPRLCMVDSLLRSKKLKGLTHAEVIELLGEPEEKGFPGGAQSCDIHYYLGPERGLIRIDSECLSITFGPDGKVNRYWLHTD
jgi:hypothetical protein